MTLEMRDWEKREEGREEGIAIGRADGIEIGREKARTELIMTMIKKGFSEKDLLNLDFNLSEIQAVVKSMQQVK